MTDGDVEYKSSRQNLKTQQRFRTTSQETCLFQLDISHAKVYSKAPLKN